MQNHIKGVHAAAMALLAETATGFLTGLHIPDNRILLIKSLHVDYLKVVEGGLTATATLSTEQQNILLIMRKVNLLFQLRSLMMQVMNRFNAKCYGHGYLSVRNKDIKSPNSNLGFLLRFLRGKKFLFRFLRNLTFVAFYIYCNKGKDPSVIRIGSRESS